MVIIYYETATFQSIADQSDRHPMQEKSTPFYLTFSSR